MPPAACCLPATGSEIVHDRLPPVWRLTSIEHQPFARGGVANRAVLFHERASLTIDWASQHVDVRLSHGKLVAIRWPSRPFGGEAVRIARLVPLDRPEAALNPFLTVPSAWGKDRDLVHRAASQWESLPRAFGHPFNAIFWEAGRFHRYLAGPSSLGGHHAEASGNLRHSVEVAERALALAEGEALASPAVLVMAALLHDAGKADEYRWVHRRFELSDRGRLIGHRHTVLGWIAAARAQHRVIVPEAHYLALMHALTAAKGAPAWLGLREPQSLDATLLSMADRLSAHSELMGRCAPAQAGFGRYHPHLGARPYRAEALSR